MLRLTAIQNEQVKLGLIPRRRIRPICIDFTYMTTQRPQVPSGTTRWILGVLALFSLLTIVAATEKQNNIITKRFAANPLCTTLPVNDRYCLPAENATFKSNDSIQFAWNTLENTNARVGALDIYLYRYTSNTPVGYWKDVSNEQGYIFTKPNQTWFDPYDPHSNNTYQFFFLTKEPSDSPPTLADRGPLFTIQLLPPPATTVSSLASVAVTTVVSPVTYAPTVSTTEPQTNTTASKASPTTGVIIAIALSTVALLLLCMMALFLCRLRNKSKRVKHRSTSNLSTASSNAPMVSISPYSLKDTKEKGELDSPVEASSIHSTTPLATKNSVSSLNRKLGPNSGIELTTSSPPKMDLDSSVVPFDAAMISDAYRKVLRKPDWKEKDDDDDFDTEVGLSEEERQRRREAKEIMKKELAEEGRGLHSVQRRHTKVQVSKIVEDDEQDSEVVP